MKKSLETLNTYSPIVTYSLFALVLVGIYGNWNQFKDEKKRHIESENDLIEQRELITSQRESLRQERDSLASRVDSLDLSRSVIIAELSKTKKELKSIKGRYNQLSQDSLGALMDRRADGAGL